MTNLPVIPRNVPTHDNTKISAFVKCPRWYSIRHVDDMRPRFNQTALEFGSAYHDGLAAWYETYDIKYALSVVQDRPYEEVEGDYRTKGLVLTALAKYIEHWGDDRQWKIILNETAFDIEDPADGFRWGGRLDLVVEWNGRLWVVDHKSTSYGGSTWWHEFDNAPQMGGYVYAGTQLHGAPIAGVIINRTVIRKSGTFEFERRPYLWPDWKLAEWKQHMIHRYQEIALAREHNSFHPNHYACVGKYGRCAAYGICTLPPVSRHRALKEDFIHDPWDWTEEA